MIITNLIRKIPSRIISCVAIAALSAMFLVFACESEPDTPTPAPTSSPPPTVTPAPTATTEPEPTNTPAPQVKAVEVEPTATPEPEPTATSTPDSHEHTNRNFNSDRYTSSGNTNQHGSPTNQYSDTHQHTRANLYPNSDRHAATRTYHRGNATYPRIRILDRRTKPHNRAYRYSCSTDRHARTNTY